MAREQISAVDETSQTPVDEPVYAVDIKAFEASGKSFQYAAFSRLCWRGHCAVCEGSQQPASTPTRPANEYLKVLQAECSKEPDFLLPGTPITEAVFRLLLANGNRPMTMQEIQSGLTAAWASVIYLKNLSDDVLRRMIDRPNEYFIVRTARKK